jgi:crotonobetainyl-CoA:carnitine CoA-transferase CaiB-like acyl-CoA transferase
MRACGPNAGRYEHRATPPADIEAVMRTRAKGEWIDRLEQAGVPCAPVHEFTDVLAHPQTSGIVQPVPGADLDLIGLPLQIDGVRPPISSRAPRRGEHDEAPRDRGRPTSQ